MSGKLTVLLGFVLIGMFFPFKASNAADGCGAGSCCCKLGSFPYGYQCADKRLCADIGSCGNMGRCSPGRSQTTPSRKLILFESTPPSYSPISAWMKESGRGMNDGN